MLKNILRWFDKKHRIFPFAAKQIHWGTRGRASVAARGQLGWGWVKVRTEVEMGHLLSSPPELLPSLDTFDLADNSVVIY
jgi:hypothetical protein